VNDLLTWLAVLYVVAGCATYAFVDTHAIAARLEASLVVVPWGVVQRYLFLVVVATWPIWIFSALSAGGGPRA
jgi:hypothetical protein